MDKDFEKFVESNFDNLTSYFNKIKEKWIPFYSAAQTFLTAHKAEMDEAEKWIKALTTIETIFANDPNASANDLLVKRRDSLKKQVDDARTKWEARKNDAGYVYFGEWKQVGDFNKNIDTLISLAQKYSKQKTNFLAYSKEKRTSEYQSKFIQFKLQYIIDMINPQDSKMVELYNKYLKTFIDHLPTLQTNINTDENTRLKWAEAKQKLINYQIENEDKLEDAAVKEEITKQEADIEKLYNEFSKLSNEILYNTASLGDKNLSKGKGPLVELINQMLARNSQILSENKNIKEVDEVKYSLNDKNGKIKKLIKALEEKEASSGFTTSLEELDTLVTQYNEKSEEYKNLQEDIIVNKAKIIEYNDAILQLEKLPDTSDIKTKYLKLYKDNLEYFIKNIDIAYIQKANNAIKEMNKVKDSVKAKAEIVKENFKKANAERKALSDELNLLTQKFTKLSFSGIENEEKLDKKIDEMISSLDVSLFNLSKAELLPNTINSQLISAAEKASLKDKFEESIPGLNAATLQYFRSIRNDSNVKKLINEEKFYAELLIEPLKLAGEYINAIEIKPLVTKKDALEQEISDLDPADPDYDAKKAKLDQEIKKLEDQIAPLQTKVEELTTKTEELEQEVNDFLDSLNDDDKESRRLSDEVVEESRENFKDKLSDLEDYLSRYGTYVNLLKSSVALENNLNDARIVALNKAIELRYQVAKTQILRNVKENIIKDSKELGVELNKNSDLIVAKTKIQMRELLLKEKIINANTTEEEIEKLIHSVNIDNIDKVGNKLVITLRELASGHQRVKYYSQKFNDIFMKFNVKADANAEVIANIDNFLNVVGYKKVLNPRMIREEGDIVDPISGKTLKGYSIYTDGYQNLIDDLLTKVPQSAQWLEGEYLDKTVDPETGLFKYEIKKGKHLGFSKDHRIGLWAVLKATDPNFKGISIDFLKFVAAHEYGHHMTLNGAKNLGDKAEGNKSIFVSALTPGATPGISNYYNREALSLYLDARTHLKLNTRTYLNGKFVLKEDGEYPVFMFPKVVVKDGKETIEYVEEKEEDIWGAKLSDPSIDNAIKNSARRFIQDFEGMKKALEERKKELNLKGKNKDKISIFDLWLPNAMDTYSGTLNPTVEGIAKYLIFDKTENKYKFLPGSLSMLEGVLKDGMGNPIKFDTVNGEILPVIADYEYKDSRNDKVLIIKKVHVYNEDGTPIISAPLNVNLFSKELEKEGYGPKSAEYIKARLDEVVENIKSLVVKKFTVNGWDNSATNLSLDSSLNIDYPEIYTELQVNPDEYKSAKRWYKEYVGGRSFANGSSTPEYQKNPLQYYVNGLPVGPDLRSRINHDNFFANVSPSTIEFLKKRLSFSSLGTALYITTFLGGNNGLRFATASGIETWIDEKTRYLPNINLNEAYESNLLEEDLSKYLDELGIRKSISSLHKFASKFVGNDINKSLWLINNAEGKAVGNNNDSGEVLMDYASANHIKLNSTLLSNDVDKSLFDSFYYKDAEKLYGSDIIFKDIHKWYDFVSLDLSKVTIDKDNKKVNWNLDYVQSKFNLNRFIRNLKQAMHKPNALTDKRKEEINNLIKADNMQDFANELMTRFSNSKLNLFTKSFRLNEIEVNENLAWIFDKDLGYGKFKTHNFTIFNPNKIKHEVGVSNLIEATKKYASENNVLSGNLTIFDYLVFNQAITVQTDQMIAALLNGKSSLLPLITTFVNGVFKKAVPSSDALSYFDGKNERKFNEFFTDYTYNFAEVINRDNLQITYSPSNSEFGNMPSYLSNINEATTGLEYVVDAESTKKWKDLVIKFNDNKEPFSSLKGAINLYTISLNNEKRNISRNLGTRFINTPLSHEDDFTDTQTFNNSYFGKFQTINNGWFKDRWYREILDFTLYDEYGKPVVDPSIRIKDLEGNVVKTRPTAYWQYYIQSQGVGLRSLSGIWRDKDKDAVAFYGYIPSHQATKANYLAFKNTKTGKIVTIPINKNNSNNMFYYLEQKLDNEIKSKKEKGVRHYLKDEKYTWHDSKGNETKGVGFISYASDYAILSKYANAIMLPGNEYEMYFAKDKSGTFGAEIYLGKTESVSENGKTFSQAPTSVRSENGKIILKVQDQFNIY
ncbi:hypothetical protein [Mycoplasma crocodyli]|uniref:PDxFFG protein n=1 Tax=Mycoplasma crocodyli (strain ATCC 51981 / MP145) TaxID=512564 RepID=D5E5D7_MYCCM|nr:hypothetical protein [Mycoplasma crocodyli]ADE19661.1 conserved hypothetical protein [Mycoplasma crocodyli MP145]